MLELVNNLKKTLTLYGQRVGGNPPMALVISELLTVIETCNKELSDVKIDEQTENQTKLSLITSDTIILHVIATSLYERSNSTSAELRETIERASMLQLPQARATYVRAINTALDQLSSVTHAEYPRL